MTACREQIERAIRATTIQPPFSFTWFGQPSHPPPANLRAFMSLSEARQHLQHALQQRLYSDFYLSGGAVARRRERTALPAPDPPAFVAGLTAANAGSGTWSSGWNVLTRDSDEVVAHDNRAGLTLWLTPDEVRDAGEQQVDVRIPPELPAFMPGFWLALSNTPFPDRTEPQVRFYWNLRSGGAAPLVEHLTRRLNDAAIPYRLKVLADPTQYTRCDAAVLYVPESAVEQALPIIQTVYSQVQDTLKPAVPALTRRLAPGLATADDPNGEESYGARCCRLLAAASIAASDAGVVEAAARLDIVLEHLAENGIVIDRPYRRAGTREPLTPDISITWTSTQPRLGTHPPDHVDFIRVAIDIARRITDEAIWDGPVCTWLGMTGDQERGQPVYGTLGPDLYGGSAGIALFLGDVFATTGDPSCGAAALGGIRHALAHASDITPASLLGHYTGLPGVAIAAARLAHTLQEPALLDSARELLRAIDQQPGREHDLLSGTAGALVAVLLLRRAAPYAGSIGQAVRLGDRLLEAAHQGQNGYSWRSGRRALTGLSHGASGIGMALLELAVVTGAERFLTAALGAFTWERRLFDPAQGNWPDLRLVSGRLRRAAPLPFGVSWCHGAPGIALARLHASALLDDEKLRDEARVALATTQRWIEVALGDGDESFCLCHGLAGNADILIDGYRAFGDRSMHDTAVAVATAGIERYASAPHDWPCGTYHGSTPGLMLGLAGIGRFYLRLAHPTLPSLLLPVAPVDV